ncbi:MAG TPA: GYF domain-containing protein [Candidatus Methylacidiphilales bacterium]|nr:GYF domain-containing protein [Candidatus Methylacidiphilales bacterium]
MYYLWLNEAQAGPFTLQQVRSMWNAGQITALTLYWQEGKAGWEPLGDIISEIEAPSGAPAGAHSPSELAAGHKPTAPPPPGVAPVSPPPSGSEQVHWVGHPTWWKWVWWFLLMVILILAAGGLYVFNLPLHFLHLPQFLALAPLPFALVIFLYIFFDRRVTRYTVTSKRVSVETGIFDRKSRELRIQDIRSIAADMNFLGYGNIEFSSAASDDAEVVFAAVAGAAAVRDLVKKLQN